MKKQQSFRRRMTPPLLGWGVALLFAASVSELVGQTRGYEPTDYYELTTVSDPAVSPTGDYVAFVVTTVVEEDNKRHREVWLQSLVGGRPDGEAYRVTGGGNEATDPRWSPDGRLLSFNSKRGEDENTVWFLRMDGPGGEAFHLEGVSGAPVWSPDGRWIAFTDAPQDADAEDQTREGWIAPDAISQTVDRDRFDGRVVTSIRYKRDGTLQLRPHYSVAEKRQIHVVPAEGGAAVQVTSLDFDAGEPVWSPDGDRLFFSGDEREDDELRADLTTDIWTVSRTGGPLVRLTTNPGAETAPAVSPDGRQMAYRTTAGRGAETEIMVVDLGPDGAFRGQPLSLTSSWDLVPGPPMWSSDGGTVRFQAGVGGNTHLFESGVGGSQVVQVTVGDRRLSDFSFDDSGRVMAYVGTDAVSPTELFVGTGDGASEQRATGFNDGWLAGVDLVAPERLTWTVADGTQIEGWVMRPVEYEPGRSYPLVLKIHGGPHGAYGNTFFPTFHVLSAAGFFVVYPNPRGSSGYGHEFMYATRGQWGVMDKEDYLGAVDAAMARYPDIDERRLGVSGGSYGGFMTNWLTATSDRFSAAATSRSISNWESWYGTSDAQGLTEYEFYGPPWERRDLYRRLSPISYVENVTAPTLIIHSENDYRTPIGDGEQWFMALKKRGVPVELVRYPRSSHGLSRTGEPWLLVDRLERIRSWFDHWLGAGASLVDAPEVETPVIPIGELRQGPRRR